ncbi:FUSC family protein [uncultured Photobacterium sp.]|uniref:FUSC family protein n=1 Tax=uncultured Photobacterium sp. TaxID=173973 RepID=UPI002613968D|nr:FUSC family protein [uncultured Photobacterium sp.]
MSEKFKFACRVAISLTLAFLIPMALGWPQASTAATTVMLIASTGSRRESLAKGTLRVMGTIVGAIIGLVLVGAFAQDRLLYMLAVSLAVTAVFYIRNAYLADPTLFMLTGVMILMMFNGGEPEGAFIYGLDRTYMTIFGVVVYTLVGIFIFPPQVEQNLRQLADSLSRIQSQLFLQITRTCADVSEQESELTEGGGPSQSEADIPVLVGKMYAAQEALEARYRSISAECSDISSYKSEWDHVLYYYRKLTELLVFATREHQHLAEKSSTFIDNYQLQIDEITRLYQQIPQGWESSSPVSEQETPSVAYSSAKLEVATHLERGAAITMGYLLDNIREKLERLYSSVCCIDSVTGRMQHHEDLVEKEARFNWWDAENAKSAVKAFFIYWLTGVIWILFNPPGGYNLVVFSTLFASILSFMPLHPVMLFILFTLGFIFSVPAYVFLLPQLTLGSELAVFIFTYTFVGFYLLKGPITIFFLIGMFTLGIDNNMVYHFGITITIVMLFYLTVFMVIFSYYFPFSSRPEHLLLVMKERYFRHVYSVIVGFQMRKKSRWEQWLLRWHLITMKATVKKLALWSGKVNVDYCDLVTAQQLKDFCHQCEVLSHHLFILSAAESRLSKNRLVSIAREQYQDKVIPEIAFGLAEQNVSNSSNSDVEQYITDEKNSYRLLENQLDSFLENIEWSDYSKSDIAGFYIYLNLKKNIFQSLIKCKVASEAIYWQQLNQNRF